MKKNILLILFFLCNICYSQIEIRENIKNEPYNNSKIIVYDSISDFKKLENPVDYLQFIGQELFLPPKNIDRLIQMDKDPNLSTRFNFEIDRTKLIYNSKYKITNIIGIASGKKIDLRETYPKALEFTLKDSLNNEIVFKKILNYSSEVYIYPFVLQGLYEKSVKEYKNQELFVFKEIEVGGGEKKEFIDLNSGETITLKKGTFWNCVSISFIKMGNAETYRPFFILKNENNEIKIELGELFENGLLSMKELHILTELWETNQKKKQTISNVQNKKLKDDCYKKFGSTICNKLLQGKLEIGMTKDMITFIYGQPIETYFVQNKDGLIEILLYRDTMLYFRNKHLIIIKGYK